MFTTNIFGQTVQRQGKDILINGDEVKIIDIGKKDDFLDTIMPTGSNLFKQTTSQPTQSNDTWYIDAIAQHKASFFDEPLPVSTANESVGDSIFSHEQANGTNSKLTNWYKPIQDKIDANKKEEVL